MSDSPMQAIASGLWAAVLRRDTLAFPRAHFKLMNLCRGHVFQGNKPALARCYPVLSNILARFYKFGKPEWPDIDRMMGGIEAMTMLIGNFPGNTDTGRNFCRSAEKWHEYEDSACTFRRQ